VKDIVNVIPISKNTLKGSIITHTLLLIVILNIALQNRVTERRYR